MSAKKSTAEKKDIRDLLKEKDAFLTTSEKIYEFCLRHTRALAGGAAAAALAVVMVVVYQNYQRSAERDAAAGYELALAAGGSEAVAAALEKVRVDFPGRLAVRLAELSLIGLYAEKDDVDKALPLAENFLKSLRPEEISLKPILLDQLGGLYETARDYPRAIQNYQALLVEPALNDTLRQNVMLALGRARTAAGDQAAAIRAYEEIVQKFPDALISYLANLHLAELKGQAAAKPRPATEAAGSDG